MRVLLFAVAYVFFLLLLLPFAIAYMEEKERGESGLCIDYMVAPDE